MAVINYITNNTLEGRLGMVWPKGGGHRGLKGCPKKGGLRGLEWGTKGVLKGWSQGARLAQLDVAVS